MRISAIAYATLILISSPLTAARADEGMWTFDHLPLDKVEETYGFRPDQAWLDHLRLSTLRIKGHGSASFVSPEGLVQTNQHVVTSCIEQLSTPKHDLVSRGFYAREADNELKCPGLELDQLLDITDVTERLKSVSGANQEEGASADAFDVAEQAIIKGCSKGDVNILCEVVELYGGSMFALYKFRRYRDVRLVFAPETVIAHFGGEIDNYRFPSYAFDVAFLRVYADGQPLNSSANYLRFAKSDAEAGDVTFTSGSPGWTHRLLTVAQLEYQRDVELPHMVFYQSELRGLVIGFATNGKKEARSISSVLASAEHSLNFGKGRLAALIDPTIIKNRAKFEKTLRDKIAADPELRMQYGAAWDDLQVTLDTFRTWEGRYQFIVGGRSFRSKLFDVAQRLVRYAGEVGKPDDPPLADLLNLMFQPDAGTRDLPSHTNVLKDRLISILAPSAIDPEVEKLTLTFSLSAMREALGPDDPFVRKVLGSKSPSRRAAELIDGTRLSKIGLRLLLIRGAPTAIDTSTDPMLVLARAIEPDWHAVQENYKKNVNAPQTKDAALIARAAFRVFGPSIYPDASYTPRISYGAVTGYRVADHPIDPTTTIGGLFQHAADATSRLPERWMAAKKVLNLQQPLNFVTTNDVFGGNSGSPVVDKAGAVVGVLFDINNQALGGEYGYDPAVNRAIGLSIGATREALAKVYHADRIVDELTK